MTVYCWYGLAGIASYGCNVHKCSFCFIQKWRRPKAPLKGRLSSTEMTTIYTNNMPWREIRSGFDVTMSIFDGAETCELVGLFLLSQLTHLGVNVGMYRDDGLATSTKTPKRVKAIKEEMCKLFKHNNLQITIEAYKKVLDFLDIRMDPRTATCKPY